MQDLIRTLEREAEARSMAILDEARETAARMVEEAERELDRRVASRIDAREREWRRAAARRLSESRLGAAARVLTAREEFLRAVFARAAARLGEISASPRYATAARALFERALSFLPPAGVEVVCDPLTARAIAPAAGEAGASVEARPDAAPGLLARATDGSVSIDATLGALLDRLRPALAMEIVARLEAE
jgi:vacuolar-type H+-ATPase subunit E/Vma4